MGITHIPPHEDKCDKCGRCIEVTITSDPYDMNNPSFASECKDDNCPMNAKYNNGTCDDAIDIYFVDCDE